MNINKDEPTDIVKKAEAQAAKIIQNANVQAKQILELARAEGGIKEEPVKTSVRAWYYSGDGDSGVFETGKQPQGWGSHPESSHPDFKAPVKKAPRKKAVKK